MDLKEIFQLFVQLTLYVDLVFSQVSSQANFTRLTTDLAMNQYHWSQLNHGAYALHVLSRDVLTGRLFARSRSNQQYPTPYLVSDRSAENWSKLEHHKCPVSPSRYVHKQDPVIHVSDYTLLLTPLIYSDSEHGLHILGTVQIHFVVKESTNIFWIHSKNITLEQPTLYVVDNAQKVTNSVLIHQVFKTNNERLLFCVSTVYPEKRYVLQLDYRGQVVKDETSGPFVQRYTSPEGTSRWMMATTLRPHHGRALFPCVDTPGQKAVFRLSVTRKKWMTVLTNTPRICSLDLVQDDWAVDMFAPTGLFSTYQLAVALFNRADWVVCSNANNSDVHVKLYEPTGTCTAARRPDVLQYVLNDIAFFDRFTKQQLPFSKIDIFALLNYETTAFEHPGLIIMNDSFITEYRPPTIDLAANILTHELAHQWLGNLVTPRTWDDLWISEGLASFITKKAVRSSRAHHVYYDRYQYAMQLMSMREDGTLSSLPLVNEFNDTETFTNIYQPMRSKRGVAVAEILEILYGEEAFQDIIVKFVEQFQSSCASVADFIDTAFETDPSAAEVDDIVAWFNTTGYPLIHVNVLNNIIVMQNYHFVSKSDSAVSFGYSSPFPGKVKLHYHLKYRNRPLITGFVVFNKDKPQEEIQLENELSYFMLNVHGLYARVSYNQYLWTRIIRAISTKASEFSFQALGRILEDSYTLSQYGLCDRSVYRRLYRRICRRQLSNEVCGMMNYTY